MFIRKQELLASVVVAAILGVSAVGGAAEPTAVPKTSAVPARMARPADPAKFYPPGAKSRGERGSPVVEACVDSTGKLLREPVITDTSGFPELDAAAVQVAMASRYKPGMDNGAPLSESCIKYRVKFG